MCCAHHFKQQNPPTAEAGTVHNNRELRFPEVSSLFVRGTVTKTSVSLSSSRSSLRSRRQASSGPFADRPTVWREHRQYSRGQNPTPSATLPFHSRQPFHFVGRTASTVQCRTAPSAASAKVTAQQSVGHRYLTLTPRASQRGRRKQALRVRGRPFGDWFMIRSAS